MAGARRAGVAAAPMAPAWELAVRALTACCLVAAACLAAAGCGPSEHPRPEAEGDSAGHARPVREGTLEVVSLNRLQGLGDPIPCQAEDIPVLPAAAELRDRLAAGGSTALLVAIGDSIHRSYKPLHGKAAEVSSRARSRIQLAGLAAAGVDAYVPGHADLATGFDDLLQDCEARGVPVLLSNVVAPSHSNIRPWLLVQAGTLKVGLLGVIASRVADAEATLEEDARKPEAQDMSYPGASVLPVKDTVARLVAELRGQQGADLVILLSNISQKANTRLSSVAGLDVIIGSTDTSVDAEGIIIDDRTAIMSSLSAGREVGHTTLAVRGGNMQMADLSPVHQIVGQVAQVEQRLADYAERFETEDPAVLARLVAPDDQQGFLNMVSLLAENKEFLALRETWTDSYIDHRAAELAMPRADHPALAAMAGTGEAIEAALAEAALKPLVVPEGRPLIPSPGDCRGCHSAQYDFWAGTAHSRAFEDLRPLQSIHDISCLPCHAAGFEDENGFSDPRFDGPFGGVSCYSCHASMALHSGSVRQVLDPWFVHADPERMECIECHVERRSPGFDKDALIASVSCPPMRADEPALLLARQAALDVIRNRRERGTAEPRDEYLEGRALVGLGAFEAGFEVLQRHALAAPKDPNLRVEIARLFERAGNSAGAIELLRRYLEDHSGDPLVNREYVTLLLEARDEAARDPQLALSHLGFLLPDDAAESRKVALDFRVLMIDAYFATGQPEKGLALINELSRDHARDPRLMARVARYIDR
jgi:hypothetical protein